MNRKTRRFRFFGGTIRTRILAATISITLFTAIAVGLGAILMSLRSGYNQAVNHLSSVAALKEIEIETWLRGLQTDLGFEAADNAPLIGALLQTAAKGRVNEAAYDALYERLNRTLKPHRRFKELFLMDSAGKMIFSTDRGRVGEFHGFRTYFRDGMKRTGTYFPASTDSSAPGSTDTILVVCPVNGNNDGVRGVFAGRVGLEKIDGIMLERTGLGRTGETYLVGSNTLLLTPSRFDGFKPGRHCVNSDAIGAALRRHAGGVGEYADYRGKKVLGVYRWLPGLKAVLLAEQDRAEAYRFTYRTIGIVTIVMVVVVLIAIAIATRITGSIARPIADLSRTASRIASGELELSAKAERDDEIGNCARAFNDMTSRLRGSIADLERRMAELKSAELSLRRERDLVRESEKRFWQLFESSPISLWEEDFSKGKKYLDGLRASGIVDFREYFTDHPEEVVRCAGLVEILDVNQATLSLMEAANKQELLAGLPKVFNEESMAVFREELIAIAEGKSRFESEAVNATLSGRKISVILHLIVAPGYEASLGRVLVSLLDITERNRAEEELARYRDHLEELVVKRTAELTKEKERAEEANRAKSVFLANMSHELRTPLNAVLGFSQLMRNSPDVTPKQKDNLDIITRSGENLLNLINNVLDISKIEAGRVEVEESAADLRQIIREIQSIMFARAMDKHLRFTIELSRDFPSAVNVDSGKLRQILLNLIGNAVKFTERGEITLRAAAQWESPSRARLRFDVEDTGPGIREEDRNRLFLPFVRLETGASTANGTGLGLAISKQYAERMGGRIGVGGEWGRGAVFFFEIPVTVLPAETISNETRGGVVARLTEGQQPSRLLIVEDQPENRLLLHTILESAGFSPREAKDGREAITVFEEWRPDLIWMDIRMPVMDGLDAMRRIKATVAGKTTKIIALTAHALEEERNEIMASGFDGFIRKPYRQSEIFDTLACHLKLRFVYPEESTPVDFGEKREPYTARFNRLPPALVEELKMAVEILDGSLCLEIARRIGETDHELGAYLRGMIEDMRLGELLGILDKSTETGVPSPT